MCTFSDNYHNTFNNNNNYPLRQDNIFYLGFESFDSFLPSHISTLLQKYHKGNTSGYIPAIWVTLTNG